MSSHGDVRTQSRTLADEAERVVEMASPAAKWGWMPARACTPSEWPSADRAPPSPLGGPGPPGSQMGLDARGSVYALGVAVVVPVFTVALARRWYSRQSGPLTCSQVTK